MCRRRHARAWSEGRGSSLQAGEPRSAGRAGLCLWARVPPPCPVGQDAGLVRRAAFLVGTCNHPRSSQEEKKETPPRACDGGHHMAGLVAWVQWSLTALTPRPQWLLPPLPASPSCISPWLESWVTALDWNRACAGQPFINL